MKKALTGEEIASKLSHRQQTQISTLKAQAEMLGKLEVNATVDQANIHELFMFYDQAFFDGALGVGTCLLEWSTRMTLCAGICYCSNFDPKTGRGTFCTIRLSKQLLKFRSYDNLLETLLHEMIHAWLFLTKGRHERNDGVDGHGPDFVEKMKDINKTTGLKLSVYHSFNDEVDSHRKHVWLCNGKCQAKAPHFGVVKRARNMPPGPTDYWWSRHQKECGGTFMKVLEPPKLEADQKIKNETHSLQQTLEQFQIGKKRVHPPQSSETLDSMTAIGSKDLKSKTHKSKKRKQPDKQELESEALFEMELDDVITKSLYEL